MNHRIETPDRTKLVGILPNNPRQPSLTRLGFMVRLRLNQGESAQSGGIVRDMRAALTSWRRAGR